MFEHNDDNKTTHSQNSCYFSIFIVHYGLCLGYETATRINIVPCEFKTIIVNI